MSYKNLIIEAVTLNKKSKQASILAEISKLLEIPEEEGARKLEELVDELTQVNDSLQTLQTLTSPLPENEEQTSDSE